MALAEAVRAATASVASDEEAMEADQGDSKSRLVAATDHG